MGKRIKTLLEQAFELEKRGTGGSAHTAAGTAERVDPPAGHARTTTGSKTATPDDLLKTINPDKVMDGDAFKKHIGSVFSAIMVLNKQELQDLTPTLKKMLEKQGRLTPVHANRADMPDPTDIEGALRLGLPISSKEFDTLVDFQSRLAHVRENNLGTSADDILRQMGITPKSELSAAARAAEEANAGRAYEAKMAADKKNADTAEEAAKRTAAEQAALNRINEIESARSISGKLRELNPDLNGMLSVKDYTTILKQIEDQARKEGLIVPKRTFTRDLPVMVDGSKRDILTIEHRLINKQKITEEEFNRFHESKVRDFRDNLTAREKGEILTPKPTPITDHPVSSQASPIQAKGSLWTMLGNMGSKLISFVTPKKDGYAKPLSPELRGIGLTPKTATMVAAPILAGGLTFAQGIADDNSPTHMNTSGRVANFLTDMPGDGDDVGIYGRQRFVNIVNNPDSKTTLGVAVDNNSADPIFRDQWNPQQAASATSKDLQGAFSAQAREKEYMENTEFNARTAGDSVLLLPGSPFRPNEP